MAGRDIIVVGASAGGVEALSRLVAHLPDDLPASVFIVLHVAPRSGSALLRILSRQTRLRVGHPGDGEPVRPNQIYVAVPDHHLVVVPGAVRVTTGPKENGHRPSVDTLFRTAAASYGPRVVGVVLSGTRDDGTAGLRAIHARGGLAVVQDPDEALFAGMPRSALSGDHPDFVLPLGEIGAHLSKLAQGWEPEHRQEGKPALTPDSLDAELRWAQPDLVGAAPADPPLISQSTDVDAARWTAYRALEERAALCRRLADRARERHAGITAEHFRFEASDVARQAEVLRAVLRSRGRTSGGDGEESRPEHDHRAAGEQSDP